MHKQIKTSPWTFLIILIMSSPIAIFAPLNMGWDDYAGNYFWIVHFLFIGGVIAWGLQLYQELDVFDHKLIETRYGLKGKKERHLHFEDLAYWRTGCPYYLEDLNGDTMAIYWITFPQDDQAFLTGLLSNINKTAMKERDKLYENVKKEKI